MHAYTLRFQRDSLVEAGCSMDAGG